MKNEIVISKSEWRKWVSKRIQQLRAAKNLTLKQVADSLDFKLARYSSYEEGRAEPSICTLKRLCSVFGISVDQFYEGCPPCTEFQEF
jgi:transcriptional regulator with XRE-family HTH domain